jgi:hypothetical protein
VILNLSMPLSPDPVLSASLLTTSFSLLFVTIRLGKASELNELAVADAMSVFTDPLSETSILSFKKNEIDIII